jgi:Uma2 family endonuclease
VKPKEFNEFGNTVRNISYLEEEKESQDVGSLNHSIVQTQVAALLIGDQRFRSIVQLSLDTTDLSQFNLKAKDELVPDVCVYPNTVKFIHVGDILKMPEMPLLAIEVVSPKQGLDEIINKFKAYFALGVKSCWLAIPTVESITVYSGPTNFKLFDVKRDTEVVDEVLDIHLPLQPIFG